MCKKKPYCNRKIDECIRKEVQMLNDAGIKTISSCCGHGKYPKTVVAREKDNSVYEHHSQIELKSYNPKKDKRHNTYYKRDKEGYYYIPELIS